jgi:hypothetical protein
MQFTLIMHFQHHDDAYPPLHRPCLRIGLIESA